MRDCEIVRKRGGTCGPVMDLGVGEAMNLGLRIPTFRGSVKVSLTSPSATCLRLSFQTLAQRISEAYTHTQEATNTPLRAIHAGIGMH